MSGLLPRALLTLLLSLGLAVTVAAAPAAAHEERPSQFPDGTGSVPKYLGLDNPRSRVVCKPDSRQRIARMEAGPLKRWSQQLLARCEFRSIQSAINTIRERRTSVYVLPGTYHERKWANRRKSAYCSNLRTASDDPLEATSYIGSLATPESAEVAAAEGGGSDDTGPVALSYPDQLRCKHNLNLIAIFGDSTPRNDSIRCDNRFCGTQIVGTGHRPRAVTIDNRFTKLNALRAERLSGLYLRNFRVQQAEFNSVYVMETDGFVIDRLAERGYLQGVVCPVIPVPVGTGVLIAGGNHNSVDDNRIWDNWRYAAMRLWVPAPLRDEYDPAKLYDTSSHNRYFGNSLGIAPGGRVAHNGLDFWWDDQGVGNCWEDNRSSRGEPTDNFTVDPAACADGGSVFVPGAPVKDAGFLSCTQYNRADPF